MIYIAALPKCIVVVEELLVDPIAPKSLDPEKEAETAELLDRSEIKRLIFFFGLLEFLSVRQLYWVKHFNDYSLHYLHDKLVTISCSSKISSILFEVF